ncbi:hypothetical protein K438DRAFT_1748228 [Mycena galopus ATCC 62051]|nr:hypothetical protein K438DRAFT_1748228 [Mycena galopus ATCC 62051]
MSFRFDFDLQAEDDVAHLAGAVQIGQRRNDWRAVEIGLLRLASAAAEWYYLGPSLRLHAVGVQSAEENRERSACRLVPSAAREGHDAKNLKSDVGRLKPQSDRGLEKLYIVKVPVLKSLIGKRFTYPPLSRQLQNANLAGNNFFAQGPSVHYWFLVRPSNSEFSDASVLPQEL